MDRIEELEQIAARRRAFAEAERVAAEKANAEYAAAYAAELPKHCKGRLIYP